MTVSEGMKNMFSEEDKLDQESKRNKDDLLEDLLNKPLDLDVEIKPAKIKPAYKEKSGFVTTEIKRGYHQIKWLVDLIKDNDINSFICGGYTRYMASPKKDPYKPGDVDVYSYSQGDYDKLRSLLRDYKSPSGEIIHMTIKHENDVSCTYKTAPDNHPLSIAPDIQLIKPLKQGSMVLEGDMITVLENFDFSVVRCGLIDEKEILVDANFDNDERDSLLRLMNIHCPISSTLRCIKYGRKGYWMRPMESLKLFIDWDTRDDSYKDKLIVMISKFEKDGLSKDDIEKLEALMRID